METEMYKSTGKLRYGRDYLVLDVDTELGRFYRSLIPKSIRWNIPRYDSHVTVVRGGHEVPPKMEVWGKHEGRSIEFEYDPDIQIGRIYIWLSVFCKELEEVRMELGLDGCFDKFKWFHMTIANMKGLAR